VTHSLISNKNKNASACLIPSPIAGAIPPGAVLNGRYEIVELLAIGGTSNIYLAHDRLIESAEVGERDVVIKVPRPRDVGGVAIAREMARSEALSTRRIGHDNIVRIHDFGIDGQIAFVVMEYLRGEPLAARLARSPGHRIPQAQAMALIREVGAALAAAHAKGVVHSDLKPGNIFITESGEVRLIDFGTARQARADAESAYLGYSPAYSSAELLDGQPPCPSDDIYSLACIAYEMLSGARPWDSPPAGGRRRPPLRRPPGLRFGRWRALRQALLYERGRRPRDVRRFVDRLTGTGRGRRTLGIALPLGALAAALATAVYVGWTDAADRLALARLERALTPIREAAQDQRETALAALNDLPPALRSAALAALDRDMIEPLLERVSRSAVHDDADLIGLRREAAALAEFYPDSARLRSAADRIERTIKERAGALTLELRGIWHAGDFSADSARRVAALIARLDALGLPGIELAAADVGRFERALRESVRNRDFLQLARMAEFQEQLPQLAPLRAVTIDPALWAAARELARYHLTDGDRRGDYPTEAADLFWKPWLAEFAERSKRVWRRSEISQAVAEIAALRGFIPPTYPPYAAARETLAKNLLTKAAYHQMRGEYYQARQLRTQARELIDKG